MQQLNAPELHCETMRCGPDCLCWVGHDRTEATPCWDWPSAVWGMHTACWLLLLGCTANCPLTMLCKWISWQQLLHFHVHLMKHSGIALKLLILGHTGHQWHWAQQWRGLVVLWHPDVRVGLRLHPLQVSAWQPPASMLLVRKVAATVYKLPAAAAKASRVGRGRS